MRDIIVVFLLLIVLACAMFLVYTREQPSKLEPQVFAWYPSEQAMEKIKWYLDKQPEIERLLNK